MFYLDTRENNFAEEQREQEDDGAPGNVTDNSELTLEAWLQLSML